MTAKMRTVMKATDHQKQEEKAAETIPQTILYESQNPLKNYIHNKRREIILQQLTDRKHVTLDVGCGDGFFLEKLSNGIGIDLSTIRAKRAKNRSRKAIIICSAEKLPFQNSTFDYIIISEVLEHLISPSNCLTEVVNLLKPEGSVIISIPNDNILEVGGNITHILDVLFGRFTKKLRYKRFAIHDHINKLTPDDLKAFFNLKHRYNVPFNLPFKLSFFHIGHYTKKN